MTIKKISGIIFFLALFFGVLSYQNYFSRPVQEKSFRLVVQDSIVLDSTNYKTIMHFEHINNSFYGVVPFALFEENIKNHTERMYAGQTLDCPSGKENFRSKTPVRVGAWSIVNASDVLIWDNLAQRFCYFKNGKPYKIIHCELKKNKETIVGMIDRFTVRNDTAFLPTIMLDHYAGKSPILPNTPLFSLVDLKTGKIIKKLGRWDSIYTKIKFGNQYRDHVIFLQNVPHFVIGRKIFYLTKLSKSIHSLNIVTGEVYSLPTTHIEQDSLLNQVLIHSHNQVFRQVAFRGKHSSKTVLEIYTDNFSKKIRVDLPDNKLLYLIACASEDELWFSGTRDTKKTIIYKTKLVAL